MFDGNEGEETQPHLLDTLIYWNQGAQWKGSILTILSNFFGINSQTHGYIIQITFQLFPLKLKQILILFYFIFKFVVYSNISAHTYRLMKNVSEIELKSAKNYVLLEDF